MKNEATVASKTKSRGIGGIILIIIGTCLLLQRMELNLPSWLFSWQSILIMIGIVMGFKHNFRVGVWLVVVLIGSIFLAGEILHWPYKTARFIWPVVLIIIGLMITLKKNIAIDAWACSHSGQFRSGGHTFSGEDRVNISAIFSGVSKIITSKNFKGGQITSVFGGTDINFMNADINDTVVLDITAVFGGCEMVVPSNWTVKVDIDSILGGVEDKRPVELMKTIDPNKVLLLKGCCVFGGVELKSYA